MHPNVVICTRHKPTQLPILQLPFPSLILSNHLSLWAHSLDSCSNIFHCASLSTTLRVVLDLRLACADVFLLFNQNYCGVKSFTTIISAQGQRLLFLWLAVFSFYKSNISASDVHTTLLCVCEFICKNQDIGFLWGHTLPQRRSISRFLVSQVKSFFFDWREDFCRMWLISGKTSIETQAMVSFGLWPWSTLTLPLTLGLAVHIYAWIWSLRVMVVTAESKTVKGQCPVTHGQGPTCPYSQDK